MRKRCDWCGKDMGEVPPYGGLDDRFSKQVTHGICQECQAGMNADNREEQRQIDEVASVHSS